MIVTPYCRYLAQVPLFWWGYHTNLGTKASYSSRILRCPPILRPQDFPGDRSLRYCQIYYLSLFLDYRQVTVG